MMCGHPWVCSCKFVGVDCDHTRPDAGGVMGTVEYNITAVGAKLTELSQVTTGPDERVERLGQAVMIAQAGGITNEVLGVLLHLATARMMTPTVAQRLRDVGIDPDRMDAIVIDRAELPPVTPVLLGDAGEVMVTFPAIDARGPGEHVRGLNDWDTTDSLTAEAHALLALAEHLAAHPPVPISNEDVEALAGLLWEYAQNPSGPGDTFAETNVSERNRFRNRARRLLATGRVAVTHE